MASKLKEFQRECLDLENNGQARFDKALEEQKLYGERYTPKNLPKIKSETAKCPVCNNELEEVHITNTKTLYICRRCNYEFADHRI